MGFVVDVDCGWKACGLCWGQGREVPTVVASSATVGDALFDALAGEPLFFCEFRSVDLVSIEGGSVFLAGHAVVTVDVHRSAFRAWGFARERGVLFLSE